MKKLIIVLIIILVAVAGVVVYKGLYSTENMLSEYEAAQIAVQAVVDDGRENWLKTECASAYISKKDSGVISFDIHEVHNVLCGGDLNTAPRITTVIVNLKTGQVFDQPTIIDTVDQGWKTIKIDGKDYQVTKRLR